MFIIDHIVTLVTAVARLNFYQIKRKIRFNHLENNEF